MPKESICSHLSWFDKQEEVHSTCMDTVVGLQLVFEAELLAAAVTFIGLLSGVDALMSLQRALVSEAAAAELAFKRVVTCWTEVTREGVVSAPLVTTNDNFAVLCGS